ncbi:hypothetical protein [Polyangium mundeleinium]|uniref:DNA-binding domain-containing protein n=1 Tax=Polyangium mundeleinium TaxID=2995306 RepID=A0ABT5F531_9BACT|nr:hypothetical protein [Polyangium mundeleinium]MDC0749196.1 hypothetical protein [Polyangium mundeleinium]
MSLSEMQRYLVRLYTDDCFRMLSHIAPEKTLHMYALSPEEGRAVTEIDRDMLETFAASLKGKRLERIQENYPLTGRLVPAAMDRYTDRFYQLFPARPHASTQEYLGSFGTFLEETLRGDEDVPTYAAELARYERLFCAAGFPPTRTDDDVEGAGAPAGGISIDACPVVKSGVCFGGFEYNITDIVSSLRHDELPCRIEKAPVWIVFQHLAGLSPPRVFEVNQALGSLLDLCDGVRTVRGIVAELEHQLAIEGLMEDLIQALGHMASIGILRS